MYEVYLTFSILIIIIFFLPAPTEIEMQVMPYLSWKARVFLHRQHEIGFSDRQIEWLPIEPLEAIIGR